LFIILNELGLGALTACQRGDITVYVEVDHGVIPHRTSATRVRDVLAETNVTLGNLDRVQPDLYVQIKPEMRIKVIRVTETTETITRTIPFERRVIVNEALSTGEQRLAQLGVTGQEEIVTKITYEDGEEVNRVELSRTITQQPVEEILVTGGSENNLTPVHFEGEVAYISGGNAWIMKDNSQARRLLTTTGDLDGRVFSLSPKGSKLLFSRTVTDVIDAPLNELWMVDTRIVGEAPISLPLKGVLYAAWSPLITDTRIAYSTAEHVASQPGWRANNDLWLWDTTQPISEAKNIIPANTRGLYPWWGSNFSWSPDGTKFAYANANEVGVIDIISPTLTTLMEFVPYQTHSEWVWVPTVSWSPNSKFIATVIHGPPLKNESAETSPVFDVWLFAADGSIKANVAAQVGMWSNPLWHPNGITYGQAVDPLRSVNSRYKLVTIDWDGSNPQTIFPVDEETGVMFPELAWMPGGSETIFVYQNNLFILRGDGTPAEPLTSNGQSHAPRWVIAPNVPLTRTLPVTASTNLTANTPLTSATSTPEPPATTPEGGQPRENIAD